MLILITETVWNFAKQWSGFEIQRQVCKFLLLNSVTVSIEITRAFMLIYTVQGVSLSFVYALVYPARSVHLIS